MPRYINIPQKPYCCVPAALSMVLLRHGMLKFSQEEIGKELGLVVPPRAAMYFNKGVKISRQTPLAGYGTQITPENDLLNNFFKKHNLPFKEAYFYPQTIQGLKANLRKALEKDLDILVCVRPIFSNPKATWGHVLVIEKWREDVLLNDPDPYTPDIIKVSIKQLFKAIKLHGKKRRAGLWIISKI